MSNKKLLDICGIAKSFMSGNHIIHALKNVNLEIFQGEVLSLLGVNGAGKTTLSSIIATLISSTSGNIFKDGNSIYDNILEYRSIIGFCPQKPNIDMMLTLEKNLYFTGKYFGMNDDLIHARSVYLMDRFGLTKYAQSHGNILSGGYKHRFVLARTLMHSPQLVILDEPTVGLDPHIRREIWGIIKELKQDNVTVLLTTHYLDEAEYLSDRVCILNNGVIQLIDTPENLKLKHDDKNFEEIFIALTLEQNN